MTTQETGTTNTTANTNGAGHVVDLHEQVEPANVHASLGQHMLVDEGFPGFVLDLEKSQGAYLYDADSGNRYLDLFTFFASNPIGMNHPKLNNPEFIQQIGKIALHKPSSSDIYTVEMAEFVETFFRVAVPEYFKYTFLIEGGALAIENALKVSFDWKVRKNLAKGYTEEKGQMALHFRHAFHGRTGYTMSLTNTDPNKVLYFPKFTEWPRISTPMVTFPFEGINLQQTIEAEQKSIAEIIAAFQTHKDDIACVIIEPIQGEGGDNHFRPEFLQALRALCDENEAMLIFDEVQTGVGLTGTMWAHQGIGVRPDILAFGKKSQVCGILVTDRVDEVEQNVFHVGSRINSTWGGNLVDMVRFAKFLEVIEEENLVENARVVGQYLLEQLQALSADFPSLVSNARGRGLMCAMDIATSEQRGAIMKGCYARGVMIIGCGTRTIRFRPPLNMTKEHVDEAMTVIRAAIAAIEARQ